jgi:hypothetical protein
MIIIRHRTGPLAGLEQQLEPRADRIVFGRDPNDCDVLYPPEATMVARRHLALVSKPSREWTIEPFADRVALNGVPAELGAVVHSGAVIELGAAGGPSFEVFIPVETDMVEKTLGGGFAAYAAPRPSSVSSVGGGGRKPGRG